MMSMGGGMGGGAGSAMQMGTAGIGTLVTSAMQFRAARKARKLAEKLNKPMKTPDAITQNVLMARGKAGTYGLPGQDAIKNELDANTSNVLASLSNNQQSPAAIAASALTAYKSQMKADAQLGIKAAEYQDHMMSNLYNQNSILAGYEMKNFDYNVRIPYERALAESAQLEGAAIENANTGLSQTGGAIGSLFGGQASDPTGGKPTPTGQGNPTQGTMSGGSYNTGFNNNQTSPGWGGNAGPQGQPWRGKAAAPAETPQFNSDELYAYRAKTGDWTSPDYVIMGQMYK